MAGWQDGDVTANGIRIHYTRTGGDKPPLVLAHGITDNGLCWTPVAEQFEQDYDVIMVDARGHGHSEAPEQGYDSMTQAADLAGVISALGLHKPSIIGHSMGAATTMALAGRYPDMPGAIVLEDPPAWWVNRVEEQSSRAERLAGMQARFSWFHSKTRAQLIADQRVAMPKWSEVELEPWGDAKKQVSENVMSLFAQPLPSASDWQPILTTITCPTLLVMADRSLVANVSAEDATALRALVPQLQVAHIAGAGHSIHRERFAPYIQVVRGFLSDARG